MIKYLTSEPVALASPCTGICTLDPIDDVCLGCGRTIYEIMNWSAMDAEGRAAVMAGLPARVAASHLTIKLSPGQKGEQD